MTLLHLKAAFQIVTLNQMPYNAKVYFERLRSSMLFNSNEEAVNGMNIHVDLLSEICSGRWQLNNLYIHVYSDEVRADD